MDPLEFIKCDFAQKMLGVTIAPEGGTLRMGPGKESRIDFFVIDIHLAMAVKEVKPREEVTFHPHRPVVVQLAERPAAAAAPSSRCD